jgi:hypothetical protein
MKSSLTDPSLAEMLSALQANERGHPGPGWFTAAELTQGGSPHGTKKKADKLVDQGVYEKCQRVVSRNLTTFYRKRPSGVQQRRTMNRVRDSLAGSIPSGKGKRAK